MPVVDVDPMHPLRPEAALMWRIAMLNFAVAFLLLALIAVVMGTGSAAIYSFWMAQILFATCAALFTLSVIRGVLRR